MGEGWAAKRDGKRTDKGSDFLLCWRLLRQDVEPVSRSVQSRIEWLQKHRGKLPIVLYPD